LKSDLWCRIGLALSLWLAVLTSPVRSPVTGKLTAFDYLHHNFATCPVVRVRAIAESSPSPPHQSLLRPARGTPPPRTACTITSESACSCRELTRPAVLTAQDLSPRHLPLRC